MGRLSEARKKAGKKKSPKEDVASGTPPEALPESVDESNLSPKAGKESTETTVETTGEGEPVTSLEADVGENPAVPTDHPDGMTSDDDAAAPPESAEDEQSWSLPPSGLADDILATLAETIPDEATASQSSSTGSSTDADAVPSSEEWDDAWASFQESKGTDNFDLEALPSSGLAEEVLQIVGRTGETRKGLSLDDIHEFESFYEEDDAHEQLQLVHFSIQDEVYALDISRVQEIIRVPVLTRVPNAPPHVVGVFNLRGRILAVFDLRTLLKLEPREADRGSRIMVLDLQGKSLGLLIDRVVEVARIDIPDVEAAPDEISAIDANLVTGVARYRDQMVFLLDVDRVLGLR